MSGLNVLARQALNTMRLPPGVRSKTTVDPAPLWFSRRTGFAQLVCRLLSLQQCWEYAVSPSTKVSVTLISFVGLL